MSCGVANRQPGYLRFGRGHSTCAQSRLLDVLFFMRRAIYPGSFDPVTNGHLDVIGRARKLFDEIVVAVAHNDEKQPLFSLEERLALLGDALDKIDHVRVAQFDGLLVDFAVAQKANAVIRGLRAVSDFEFEFQMALMNRKLEDSVHTIFLMPKEEYTYLSSRLVKEIARLGGNVSGFVPRSVAEALVKKFKRETRKDLASESSFKTNSGRRLAPGRQGELSDPGTGSRWNPLCGPVALRSRGRHFFGGALGQRRAQATGGTDLRVVPGKICAQHHGAGLRAAQGIARPGGCRSYAFHPRRPLAQFAGASALRSGWRAPLQIREQDLRYLE